MQTVLDIVLEVIPKSAILLEHLIEDFKSDVGTARNGVPAFGRLKESVPSLHFMSMSVFRDDDYDPFLIIELNFDGPAGPFLSQLEAAIGDTLREMVRCCKEPRGPSGSLYRAVTAPGSRLPLAPYLEAHTENPVVYHVGSRGLDRARIEREADLFAAARDYLAADRPVAAPGGPPLTETDIHARLRAAMLRSHPWIAKAAPPRIPTKENAADWLRAGLFLTVLVFGLSLPGIVLGLIVHPGLVALLFLLAAPLVASRVDGLSALRGGGGSVIPPGPLLAVLLALVAYLLAVSFVGAVVFAPLTFSSFGEAFRGSARSLATGLTSLPFSLLCVLWALRYQEASDPTQDEPPIDEKTLSEMTKREDLVAQNHMGSMVLVKPGVLRAVLIRVGLHGLGHIVRIAPPIRRGYLGSMRTIHFAHWAFVGNGSRLLFFSNFDGSWESYLDDFIEKAHVGLTLAWCSGVGFPPARFMTQEGATHGRQFKTWARHSMAISRFWYSAYPDYTVDQIERHARVADGLRRPSLTREEAQAWALDL